MAENAAEKQRGKPFPKGQSGNPKGKAKGCRNHATRVVQALLEGESVAITRKLIDLALGGDVTCLRLCIERLCPVRRDSPMKVTLPAVEIAKDLPKVSKAILGNVARGNLTTNEGQGMMNLLESHARVMSSVEAEAEEQQAYCTISPEEMAERAARRRTQIESQRIEFLPQRQSEVQAIKDELGDGSFT